MPAPLKTQLDQNPGPSAGVVCQRAQAEGMTSDPQFHLADNPSLAASLASARADPGGLAAGFVGALWSPHTLADGSRLDRGGKFCVRRRARFLARVCSER
jgi:hypothetical protein